MSAEIPPRKSADNDVVRELTHTQRVVLILAMCSIVAAVIFRMYMNDQLFPARARADRSGFVSIEQQTPREVAVHVKGAVRYPGMYRLPKDARVDDAIKAAGGVVEGAESDSLNLAARLEDGEVLMVPGEAVRDKTKREPSNVDKQKKAKTSKGKDIPAPHSININSAGVADLCRLPGIGESMAMRIVKLREIRGPYLSIEELSLVDGVGESKLKQIREYIKLK